MTAWLEPGAVPGIVRDIREALGAQFHSFSHLLCNVALLIASGEDADLSAHMYSQLTADSTRLQQISLLAYAGLARAFGAAIRGDSDEVVLAREDLAANCCRGGQFDYLLAVIDAWHGAGPGVGPVQWVDGGAISRWVELLAKRKELAWPGIAI